MIFGQQLAFAAKVLEAHRNPLDFGPATDGPDSRVALAREYSRVVMQIIVSLAILSFSGYVLVHREYGETLQKAATGFIGTVVGYWLR